MPRSAWNHYFKEFNSSEKAYLVGQVIHFISLTLVVTLLILLVKALTDSAAMSGVIRAAYFISIAVFALFSGEYVRKHSVKNTLVLTFIAKAVIFFLIAFLFMLGKLTLTGLIFLIALSGVIAAINHLYDYDTGGANKIFSSAQKKEKGLYLCKLFIYVAQLIVPLVAGVLVEFLDFFFKEGIGVSVVFFLCAGISLWGARIYSRLQPIVDISTEGKDEKWHTVLIKTPQRLWTTATLIYQNKAVLLRSIMSVLERFLDESIRSVVLPAFALDILMTSASGLGLLLAALNLGGVLAAILLLKYAKKIQKAVGFYRFLFYLVSISLFSFLPSIILWTSQSLWMAAFAVLLMKFLYDPVSSRMHTMLQIEIHNDPAAKPQEENIFGLMSFFETLATAFGALFFVWLFFHSGPDTKIYAWFGPHAALKIVTISLLGISLFTWLGLIWIKKQIIRVYYSAPGVEEKTYALLDALLENMKLPSYHVMKKTKRNFRDRPAIAILDFPTAEVMPLLQVGGKLSPGDVHLVMDPSWFIQEMQPDQNNLLYIKKGLYFDHEGNPVMAEYRRQRPINYFVNFFTIGANLRADGIPLEARLAIPMANSLSIERIVNDKLYTLLLLTKNDIPIPLTLAWLMPKHLLIDCVQLEIKTRVPLNLLKFPLSQKEAQKKITQELKQWFEIYPHKEWVVKGSGPSFRDGYGVNFFSSHQFEDILQYIFTLQNDSKMQTDGAILIEERIIPPAIYLRLDVDDGSGNYCFKGEEKHLYHLLSIPEEKTAKPGERKDWNLRIIAARTPWNKGITCGIMVRAGTWGGSSLTSENTANANLCLQLEHFIVALRIRHGLLKTDEEASQFKKDIELLGAKAFEALIRDEHNRHKAPGEPLFAETDYMGFDAILQVQHEGRLAAYIVEVNDHDFFGQYPFDQFYSEIPGNLSKPWLKTMFARSRRHAMKGKRLVIVGSGYKFQEFYFKTAVKLGLHIILIDKAGSWAEPMVDEFIAINPEEAFNSAKEALGLSIPKYGDIDGIATFSELDVNLTAMLAEEFDLPYHSLNVAQTARNKFSLRTAMQAAGLRTPLFFLIRNGYDLEIALHKITRQHLDTGLCIFPMVIKPTRRADGAFAYKINHADEARNVFAMLEKNLEKLPDSLYTHHHEFILEEYIGGYEWGVDLILQAGRVLYSSITDNWATNDPYFAALGSTLPTRVLSPAACQASIEHSIVTVHALGFTDGVLHIHGKYDLEKGPYLLEINARPGEAFVVPWNLAVWGVDLAEMLFATALRVPIILEKAETPLTFLEGKFFISEATGKFIKIEGVGEIKTMPGFKTFDIYLDCQQTPLVSPMEKICFVSAEGTTPEEAYQNLQKICAKIKIHIL